MEKTDTYARRGHLSDDDLRLWRNAMREVRPLTGSGASPPSPPATEPPRARAPEAPVGRPGRRAPPEPPRPVRLPELRHGTAAGLDKRRAERLRRGKMAVEGRIDLHGMTQEAAKRALDAFVASSHAAERRVLLVITGKGVRPGAARQEDAVGILRQAVPRWLNERPNRERVLAFSHAQPRDGGTGALYVLLRRKRQ